jgi:hypothetical protein
MAAFAKISGSRATAARNRPFATIASSSAPSFAAYPVRASSSRSARGRLYRSRRRRAFAASCAGSVRAGGGEDGRTVKRVYARNVASTRANAACSPSMPSVVPAMLAISEGAEEEAHREEAPGACLVTVAPPRHLPPPWSASPSLPRARLCSHPCPGAQPRKGAVDALPLPRGAGRRVRAEHARGQAPAHGERVQVPARVRALARRAPARDLAQGVEDSGRGSDRVRGPRHERRHQPAHAREAPLGEPDRRARRRELPPERRDARRRREGGARHQGLQVRPPAPPRMRRAHAAAGTSGARRSCPA